MAEGEIDAEPIEQLKGSRYFSREFVENAPVDQGSQALMDWLDVNLEADVQKEVAARLELTPPEHRAVLAEALQTEAHMVSRILWRWTDFEHRIKYIMKDPESRLRGLENAAKVSPKWLEEMRKEPEMLRERQKGVGILIGEFNLYDEQKILKDLFERALATDGQQERGLTVIEGTISEDD